MAYISMLQALTLVHIARKTKFYIKYESLRVLHNLSSQACDDSLWVNVETGRGKSHFVCQIQNVFCRLILPVNSSRKKPQFSAFTFALLLSSSAKVMVRW